MASDVAYEIDADPAGPVVVRVPVQPQRPEVPLELPFEQRCRLAAASVPGALGAHQDQVFVGAWAGLERRILGAGGWKVGVVQRGGCCGGGGYVVVDELGHGVGGDVVDEGEGGEEEDARGTVLWWVGFVGG